MASLKGAAVVRSLLVAVAVTEPAWPQGVSSRGHEVIRTGSGEPEALLEIGGIQDPAANPADWPISQFLFDQ